MQATINVNRTAFKTKQLQNGITIHSYADSTPYTDLYIYVPVGTANNANSIRGGSFHFLEHILLERSQLYPKPHAFERFIGLKAGFVNAVTSAFWTKFILSVPTSHWDEALPGFLAHIFEPLFAQEDIDLQRGIVRNERQRRARWFPGSSEMSQYMHTEWQWDRPFSLEQIFGSDRNLASFDVAYFEDLQQLYLDPRIEVIVGGSGDLTELINYLTGLQVKEHHVDEQYEALYWKKPKYHEKRFRDISRYELWIGGIATPNPGPTTVMGLRFLSSYLTNNIHGALYQWLREEKGWVYELSQGGSSLRRSFDWTMRFPLSSHEQVAIVRKELNARIEDALNNTEAINQEVDRQLDMSDAYYYQKLSDILADAESTFESYGRIVNEGELRQELHYCRDPKYLKELYERYYLKGDVGEFCAMPTEK